MAKISNAEYVRRIKEEITADPLAKSFLISRAAVKSLVNTAAEINHLKAQHEYREQILKTKLEAEKARAARYKMQLSELKK